MNDTLPVEKWASLWIFTDGVPHGIYVLILVTMMYLWAPNEKTQRLAYSQQLEQQDCEGGATEMPAGVLLHLLLRSRLRFLRMWSIAGPRGLWLVESQNYMSRLPEP